MYVQCCNFLSEKLKNYFSASKILQFLVIKSLDPGPELDPEPNWNQCENTETSSIVILSLIFLDLCISFLDHIHVSEFFPLFPVYSLWCRFEDPAPTFIMMQVRGYLSTASKVGRNYGKITVKNHGSDTSILYKNIVKRAKMLYS